MFITSAFNPIYLDGEIGYFNFELGGTPQFFFSIMLGVYKLRHFVFQQTNPGVSFQVASTRRPVLPSTPPPGVSQSSGSKRGRLKERR